MRSRKQVWLQKLGCRATETVPKKTHDGHIWHEQMACIYTDTPQSQQLIRAYYWCDGVEVKESE